MMTNLEDWVSVAEASRRSGYTDRWIHYLVNRGLVPRKPFGRRSIQVDYCAVQRYLDSRNLDAEAQD
jgi:hypothetical protein